MFSALHSFIVYPVDLRAIFQPQKTTKWRISKTPSGIFLYSLVLCVLQPYMVLFSWLSCILPFVFTYNTQDKHPCPPRDFVVFSRTLFVLQPYFYLCLGCPTFCCLSLLYNTQHMHPCRDGIQTPNSSKRSAADRRLRTLCQWYRQGSNRDLPACSAVPPPIAPPRAPP